MSGYLFHASFSENYSQIQLLRHMASAQNYRGNTTVYESIDRNIFIQERIANNLNNRECNKHIHDVDGCLYYIAGSISIYNRSNILKEINKHKSISQSISDDTLIVELFSIFKDECVNYIDGDFSFCIYDDFSKSLFMARDRFGIRPIYYAIVGGGVFVSSDIGSLARHPSVSAKMSHDRLKSFIENGEALESEETWYQNVFKLPAATCTVVSSSKARSWKYWAIDPSRVNSGWSEREYINKFRSLFRSAVEKRCTRGGAVGAFLSGGLDSSSISCMASLCQRDRGAARLQSFTASFNHVDSNTGTTANETAYAEAVLKSCDIPGHVIPAQDFSMFQDFEKLLIAWGQPYDPYNIYFVWGILNHAADQGVHIMLDGMDGDTVVQHGYGWLNDLANESRWNEFVDVVRQVQKISDKPSWPLLEAYAFPALRRKWMRGQLTDFLLGGWLLHREFNISLKRSLYDQGPQYVGKGYPHVLYRMFLQLLDRGGNRTRERMSFSSSMSDRPTLDVQEHTPFRAVHAQAVQGPFWQRTFEVLSGPAGFHGIEIRSPFFDRELVEFCVALPHRFKLRHGYNRWILREAMQGVVPDKVRFRTTKANLESDYLPSVFRDERARDLIASCEGLANVLRSKVLTDAWSKYASGSKASLTPDEVAVLVRAVTVVKWTGAVFEY